MVLLHKHFQEKSRKNVSSEFLNFSSRNSCMNLSTNRLMISSSDFIRNSLMIPAKINIKFPSAISSGNPPYIFTEILLGFPLGITPRISSDHPISFRDSTKTIPRVPTGIPSGISPGVSFGILLWIPSGIPPGMPSRIHSWIPSLPEFLPRYLRQLLLEFPREFLTRYPRLQGFPRLFLQRFLQNFV